MERKYMLAVYDARISRAGEGLMDIRGVAEAAGLHPDLVGRLVHLGLLETSYDGRGGPLFDPGSVLRMRRMMRLRSDLGLAWTALGLIADLLERIDNLEATLRDKEGESVPIRRHNGHGRRRRHL